MRLPCPSCGLRNNGEFVFRGDAAPRRPTPDAPDADWSDYVYLRDNVAGPMRELWYHTPCRSWMVITRDTRTHDILGAEDAVSASRTGAAA
ncbi:MULTISPECIES: sarcosine oxidase subunit delta [Nguyenibacter]|uniref:Sarcosine oxidase subunit delta n=1 Tax=Nguyenibacter vanlangensis TaxID=1216886 RepID=A0A7Y7ITT4_9PROT|nr:MULTISPECIES: sarcosine oxidase subunit delta [Nguyenibacter]NVN09690.1 sarcosine oxidase subunit delta [Nguyenibacter vanlangensis]WRH87127.1 sarcosine oxidase subunit delta [Nguyenibacter sp. L1]